MSEPQKTALVTGASRGIGLAITEKMAEAGYNLALCARNADKLALLAQQLREKYQHLEFLDIPCDIRDCEQIAQAVSTTLKRWQRLDVLVNNAGIATKSGLLQEFSKQTIDDVIDTNLKGAIYAMQAVIPAMSRQQAGTIININSTAGKTAFPYWGIYAASKFGLDAVTRAVAEEQRSNGIRVVGVYPGAVDTHIWDSSLLSDEERQEGMIKASDIADSIIFLLNQPSGVWISELVVGPLNPAL